MDIYQERKLLGEKLVDPILKAIDNDVVHTVFSFIPNTAEVAFYGMLEGFDNYLNQLKIKRIEALGHKPSHSELEQILSQRIRSEKVAIKDIKLRTFIAEGNTRNDLAAHVYDITYGSLIPYEDNLVIIDDSIVRGTTLKQSIISILDRLHPKKIVIVSSSPQVRYPDYYGIDMASIAGGSGHGGCYPRSLPEIEGTGRSAERTDGELCEGNLCAVHGRRGFRQDGGTADTGRYPGQGRDCLSDTGRPARSMSGT